MFLFNVTQSLFLGGGGLGGCALSCSTSSGLFCLKSWVDPVFLSHFLTADMENTFTVSEQKHKYFCLVESTNFEK